MAKMMFESLVIPMKRMHLKRLWLTASKMRRGIVANRVRGKASGLDNT